MAGLIRKRGCDNREFWLQSYRRRPFLSSGFRKNKQDRLPPLADFAGRCVSLRQTGFGIEWRFTMFSVFLIASLIVALTLGPPVGHRV